MMQQPVASMVFLLFILTLLKVSDGAWCVCKNDASTAALQKTIDYACGAGADCNPIHQNGACYNPNTVLAHCSYAANSYYQRNAQNQQACDFAGTAQLSSNDPSQPGCTFPASQSAAGTSSTTTSSTGGGNSSFNTNSPTTTGGTFSNNLGPSAFGIDSNHASFLAKDSANIFFYHIMTSLVLAFALMEV